MKKLLLLFALGVSVSAAGLPELRLPGTVGVNIHFTRGHERDLELIQAAGIRVVRMDFVWASIERSKGQYDWSAYDELTASLIERGIRPYYILDYSNGLYEETVATINPVTGKEQRDVASPQRPESVAAFARWAAAAVERFKGRGIVWEIWNEPNITFWKPKPDVQQYIALALAACKAIRAADPEALVVGPATSELPLPFLDQFFASGILARLDAVSVHPYRNYSKGPETALEEYKKLRELIEKYAPEGKKQMPILSGEWGYASHTKGVSLEVQANFLVRQQLVNLHAGIPVSIWYDWKNDGPNPAEREDNFGTVSHNLEPKPAYLALQRMTRELDGFSVVRRLETENPNAWALLLADRSGKQKLAAWSAAGPLKAQVTPEIALDLTPAPLYVSLERPIR
jgi:beta-xylosidase